MADNSGGTGLAGVLIGALLVLVIGGGLLMMTGVIGKQNTSTVSIQLPKVAPSK
ncbi:MAG: hypothetical protein KF826_01895 [Xanthobacteraceae bacterium]|nr:hypothetical protein [Xanthobacteraceae bacterium]MBX3520471.1 hypothetical protein [Xanthobacteraceae bacterium]MBX3522810.1 hypothetical protein [Xanthobacteraceae bacterium]MBX3533081.1 hypothetical protein [Xanthobacteraceae bacterium]MBX3550245.1 hypothetical protein [Xanthobacteraceae bacterium]